MSEYKDAFEKSTGIKIIEMLPPVDRLNPEPESQLAAWLHTRLLERDTEITTIRRELSECKAQIEAMKDCQNCKHGFKTTLIPPICDECIASSDLKNRYPNWQPKGVKQ